MELISPLDGPVGYSTLKFLEGSALKTIIFKDPLLWIDDYYINLFLWEKFCESQIYYERGQKQQYFVAF